MIFARILFSLVLKYRKLKLSEEIEIKLLAI
jgi:hypothetical protein